MSNHLSAADIENGQSFLSPGGDARLDLTDLFVFSAPDDPGRTVMILCANPFTQGDGFHPDAVYRFNVDTNGDSLADVAFSFTFSALERDEQTATVHYATGSEAQTREPRGDVLVEGARVGFGATAAPVEAGRCRLFIGARSDPFFADAEDALNWLSHGAKGLFRWTGNDFFLGKNVYSIALEAPNDMLGPGPGIGVWVTISLRRDSVLVPMDREGNPSFNPILNAPEIKNDFNATDPVDDVKKFLKPLSETLERHGYPHGEARTAALTILPDILHYDRTAPAHYPNGRVVTDDVFSARMIFMTHGQVEPQSIKPHEDLLAEFPYLGLPNAPLEANARVSY